MLSQMFNMQKRVEDECKSDVDSQQHRNTMSLALVSEIIESLNETPWKPWKKNQKFNIEKYRKELIDCWAFLISLTFPVMSEKELYDLFKEKYEINIKRQKEGY